jgi:hypothetical protein
MNKGGRPTTYSQEMVSAICERIAEGESLRAICRDPGMPNKSTVFLWLSQHSSFSDQYARAKEESAEAFADEIVEIADERDGKAIMVDGAEVAVVFDSTAVARNRLRVDARKWVASKLKPKKYGEKIGIDHSGSIETLTDDRLNARLAELLGKAGAIGAAGRSGEAEGEA